MAEGDLTPEQPQKNRKFWKRVREGLKYVLDPRASPPEIPLEQINEKTVAGAINNYLASLERLGQGRWDMFFSIVDVLGKIGRVADLIDTDYRDRFPNEYRATRFALTRLVQEEALEMVPLENPDRQKETIYYKVVDEGRLKEIAKGMTTEVKP